jgi:hypothetical protein
MWEKTDFWRGRENLIKILDLSAPPQHPKSMYGFFMGGVCYGPKHQFQHGWIVSWSKSF